MPSNLLQLFRYARAEKMDAKENFTTEALAATIRYDARPFLAVLRNRGFLRVEAAAEVTVHTQVHVSDVGFIDLVLVVRDGERLDTLWIEVKVDAGEHGNQLSNYLRYTGEHGITLLTLGRESLRDDIQHVTWLELRRAALAADGAFPTWRDFASFLEEIGMADDYDEPLNDAEVASLGSGFALLRKVAHLVDPVARHANELWPGSDWPTKPEDVLKILGEQFRKYGRMTIYSRVPRAPAWVVLGVAAESRRAPRGLLHVAVEARPKDLASRAALDKHYLANPLPTPWTRPKGGYVVFLARENVPDGGDPPSTREWFTARLADLDHTGMLGKMSEFAKAAPLVPDPTEPSDVGGS